MVENFMDDLLKKLKMSRVNDEYDFQLMEVVKRNDEHRKSLCIRKKGDAIGVNLYMDDLVRRFENAEYDMEALVEDIIEQLKTRVLSSGFTELAVKKVMELKDYDNVKDSILFRLINLESNKEYLKNAVYAPYLDLAICFYIVVGEGNEVGTMQLTKDIFNSWGISVDELYEQAMENTSVLMPYVFRSMSEVLNSLIDEVDFSQYMNPPEYKDCGLWVLGNEKQIFGASAILYKGIMRKVAEIMNVQDIVILPSSVHECILLPLPEDNNVSYLKEMVSEVNNSQVEPEDRLSYSVYKYSLKNDEISILTE